MIITGNHFFHLPREKKEIDVLCKTIRESVMAEDTDHVEISINCLNGSVWAPSKRNKLFRVSIGFAPDQFDRDVESLERKSIKEIEQSHLICIAIVKKEREVKTDAETPQVEKIG